MSDSLSFGGLLGGMKWLFPRALLSGDGLERLLLVAERLPPCVIDKPFGFEFALCNEAADVLFVAMGNMVSLGDAGVEGMRAVTAKNARKTHETHAIRPDTGKLLPKRGKPHKWR